MSFGKMKQSMAWKAQKVLLAVVLALAVAAQGAAFYDVIERAQKTIDAQYTPGGLANTRAKQDLQAIVDSNAPEAEKIKRIQERFLQGAQPETKVLKPVFNGVVTLAGGVRLELAEIPAGSFTMGSPADEPGRFDDEKQHRVTITQAFWLGKCEVTQAEWQAVMGTTVLDQARKALQDDTKYPELGKKTLREFHGVSRDADPARLCGDGDGETAMYWVSWEEAQEFCRRLNEQGLAPAGWRFALPTEAQWEYACRAGTRTALYNGPIEIIGENNAPALDAIAWYGGNSSVGYTGIHGWDTSGWKEKQHAGGKAHARRVGKKQPNGWGLHDMIGNVWEWCGDWNGSYGDQATDPTGPKSGLYRVIRGGSWDNGASRCRAACRGGYFPSWCSYSLGFRLALVQVP